jgi:hypothetical protein
MDDFATTTGLVITGLILAAVAFLACFGQRISDRNDRRQP